MLFQDMIWLFLTPWSKILFGFFAVGIGFFLGGRQISSGLLISCITLLVMFGLYPADMVFLYASLLCMLLGLALKQGGL